MGSTIPDKAPKVTVEPVEEDPNGRKDSTLAMCRVWTCGWWYANVVKSDVAQQATRHREAHRAAARAEA